jgi:hypothetical protein
MNDKIAKKVRKLTVQNVHDNRVSFVQAIYKLSFVDRVRVCFAILCRKPLS